MAELKEVTQAVEKPVTDFSISINVAELAATIIWPILILIIVLLLRKQIPAFARPIVSLFQHAEKITIGSFSMELAKVKEIVPQWTPGDSMSDIRKSMSSSDVSDSTAYHFTNQLGDTTPADFAIIDLGDGRDWLSSRLFIISILLARAKSISAFVFVKSTGKRSKRIVGWAEPEKIRWALARKCPWLESAFANSYAELFPNPPVEEIKIVSSSGMLGTQHEGASPQILINLLQTFLEKIQHPVPPAPEEIENWVELQAYTQVWEHACWLSSDDIEDILSDDLKKKYVYSRELDSATKENSVKRLLQVNQEYIPVVDDNEQFRELVDRDVIAKQVLDSISKT